VAGCGDQFHSYTPYGIKRVGIWDERFSCLAYSDADYMMRQLLFNTDHCSLNDTWHGRTFNTINAKVVIDTPSGLVRKDVNHSLSSITHEYGRKMWHYKFNYIDCKWDINYILKNKNTIINHVPYFIWYPYFEQDVETLQEQGLFTSDPIINKPWF
jgi:hypothetical protein